MKNCYIDPIFLAINDTTSSKFYYNNVFLVLNKFLMYLQKLEKDFGEKFIQFNISQEIIIKSMEFNPFRSESFSFVRRFKEFISLLLRK